MFAAGHHMEDIMISGRWASLSSARLYVKRGEVMAQQSWLNLPVAVRTRIISIGNCLHQSFAF